MSRTLARNKLPEQTKLRLRGSIRSEALDFLETTKKIGDEVLSANIVFVKAVQRNSRGNAEHRITTGTDNNVGRALSWRVEEREMRSVFADRFGLDGLDEILIGFDWIGGAWCDGSRSAVLNFDPFLKQKAKDRPT